MKTPLLFLAATLAFASLIHAQTPVLHLRFNGNLSDSSPTPRVITAVTPNSGFTPSYALDRNNSNSQGALVFTGGQSLQLVASSLPGNSNQALGLRNASGTNTSFTLATWVMFTSLGSGQGYSTIFGNLGSGAGTLRAGLNNNSDKTHFGFDNNDLNGGASSLVTNVWYHFAVTYDGSVNGTQRIYINGIPDATRTGVSNTLKIADLLIGNHGSATDTSNDFKGRLDDLVVFNTALKGDQIMAIANKVDVTSVPAANTYFPPPTTLGYRGGAGQWGIREIAGYPGISYNSLVNLDRILSGYAITPGGTKVDYFAPVIDFADLEAEGNLGYFDNESTFGTDTGGDDNNFLIFARCTVKIPAAGDYTFGFSGDDGARLRIVGQRFTSSTRLSGSNHADPAHLSDTLLHPNNTGSNDTLGVVNLAVGEYDLEFSYWEGNVGSSVEVFAAPGAKTSVDSSFQLIGNTAAGGLEIITDSDTLPTFTVNGGASVLVENGVPSTITLAWAVNDPGTTLSINQGIGSVAQNGSITLPTPGATTTYTITATTGGNVVTKSVNVIANSAPSIISFTANDTTVVPGANVTLTWNTQAATSLTLNPGGISVTGTTSIIVNPASTTTYTLTATNSIASTNANLTVTTGPVPVVTNFTTSDVTPVYGKETALAWTVTNSTSQSINQGIGSIPASGSLNLVSLLSTTFTLTAVNDFGSTTATTATSMPTPLGVAAPGFTARRVSATTPLPFSGQGYLQSALSLLGGQNAGTTATGGPYTTINFADGADGDYTTGNNGFPGGGGDHFAVEITGTLIVNTPGEYTFMVNSDDGCRLRIDGVDVIVDDATHTASTSSGRVVLSKPTATFELIHYDASGGAHLEVSWVRPNLSWQQLGIVSPAAPIVRGGLILNEFVASGSTLADEDSTTQDWIEIWNSTDAAIDLAGHFLTNSAATPNVWAFPSKIIAPNEYLVVFASGKNRVNPAANLHTSFNLPGGGGYLALKKSNGLGGFTTLTEFNPYPAQASGRSYGSSDREGYVGFMEVPTPGAPNAASYTGFLTPVTFSTPRGRYTAAFNLALSSATPGATIRYTLDGSEPTWNRGTVYTAPFNVSSTSIVRATAFLAGWKPSVSITHSYLFVDDIVAQSATQAASRGWPQSSVNGQVYRYGMNQAAVTSAGATVNDLKSALAAAPSVCMNLNPEDFHGASTGINSNPGKRGRFWERAASLEIINPDGTSAVQKDCGVRIRGGASRTASNPKHAFHLYFRSLYAGDLIHPIFGSEGAVTRFDQLDMRCEQNNSWSKDGSDKNAFMREQYARAIQRDMGQPYSRSGYFHLYINGIYWGIFNWQEKTEADYAANQFGGQDTDYDTVKSAGSSSGYNTELTDGNDIAWRNLFDLCLALKAATTNPARDAIYFQMQGLNPNGTRNTAFPILLSPDNQIDAQIATFWNGNFDGPVSTFIGISNNWFALRKRDGSQGGFMFFLHDNEHSMGTSNNSYNRVGPWGVEGATSNNWSQTWTAGKYASRTTFSKFNPQYLHEFLCFSPEYRQRFNDRAQKHLTGNGALSQTAAIARADALVAQIDPIVHAEAARWGSTALNKNTWFNTGRAGVYSFINTSGSKSSSETQWPSQARNLTVIEQLKGYTDEGAKPLFINVSLPVISGVAGGLVNAPHSFTITNPQAGGTIYYTLDGTDPRAIGGGIASGALTGSSPIGITLNNTATVKARVFNSATNAWSGIVENVYLVASPASAANLVISELHYNPTTAQGLAEFVEITNISNGNVLIGKTKFTAGIIYTFPDNLILPAGGRCLIVENSAIFAAQYPSVPVDRVIGQYSNTLSNGGEQITYTDAANVIIKDFVYDDVAPWPLPPDGAGPSLVLIKPETNPAHGTVTNWRSSGTNGGSPGSDDGVRLASWFTANGILDTTGLGDKDKDGHQDLIEYALGLNPSAYNSNGLTTGTANVAGQDYMTLVFTNPIGRDDVSYQAQAGTGLETWANAILLSNTPNFVTGVETQVWRHTTPKSESNRQFLRLKVAR